jgi:hypothetical protein
MLSDANLSLCSLGSGQQSPCVRIPAHCLAGHKSMNVLSGSVLVAKAMIKTNALNDWMFRDFLNDKDISQAIFSLPSGGLTFYYSCTRSPTILIPHGELVTALRSI